MQITTYRLSKILPWEKIYCVTVSEAYKKEILKEVSEFVPENIIVEPARRETGPAHGIGAAFIYKKDPDAVIATEAADRLATPVGKYLSVLKKAARVAYTDRVLVTVGVKPRYPHTGMGHIRRGKKYKQDGNLVFYKVDEFVEKPPLDVAKKYTSSGKYYWNTGQFVWRADSILKAIEQFEPKVGAGLTKISQAIGTKSEASVIKKEYNSMPKIAIDYAVAERAENLVVAGATFNWTDIGDWKEVWKSSKKDQGKNVIIDGIEKGGEIINIDTTNTLIHTNGRLIAVVGVEDLVIVDTENALLVTSKAKAQGVKKVVNKLREDNRKELL